MTAAVETSIWEKVLNDQGGLYENERRKGRKRKWNGLSWAITARSPSAPFLCGNPLLQLLKAIININTHTHTQNNTDGWRIKGGKKTPTMSLSGCWTSTHTFNMPPHWLRETGNLAEGSIHQLERCSIILWWRWRVLTNTSAQNLSYVFTRLEIQ